MIKRYWAPLAARIDEMALRQRAMLFATISLAVVALAHVAFIEPVLVRQMELYAAFLEHTDHQIGRVVDAIERLGILNDTLIFVITGDNGASGEGTINGTWNEALTMTGMVHVESPEFLREHLHTFGTPDAAHAKNAARASRRCRPRPSWLSGSRFSSV